MEHRRTKMQKLHSELTKSQLATVQNAAEEIKASKKPDYLKKEITVSGAKGQPSERSENGDVVQQAIGQVSQDRGKEWVKRYLDDSTTTSERAKMLQQDRASSPSRPTTTPSRNTLQKEVDKRAAWQQQQIKNWDRLYGKD